MGYPCVVEDEANKEEEDKDGEDKEEDRDYEAYANEKEVGEDINDGDVEEIRGKMMKMMPIVKIFVQVTYFGLPVPVIVRMKKY